MPDTNSNASPANPSGKNESGVPRVRLKRIISELEARRQLRQSEEEKDVAVPLDGVQRLQALDELHILDAPIQRNFQVLVDLANKFLGTPVALISLVTDDRQFFVSSSGLGEPWSSCRETPLSHSFCKHVVERNEPFIVSDAKSHKMVKDNKAIEELGVQAYLGVPITLPGGVVIGSFCAIDTEPRTWSLDDQETIEKLVELTIVELTVRKEARQRQAMLENRLSQAQKMQAIGHLVGGIAHDFNNVLGAIQIQAELLQAQLDGRNGKPVNHIQDSVRSAKAIVQQLLNWSRPSTGGKVPVSVSKVVSESLPLISTYATKFIEINFDAKPCSDIVRADPNKLSQVLLNLCSNSAYAMKHTNGQITISVTSVYVDSEQAVEIGLKPGTHVKLSVADTDCGIPKELRQRIHEPYFTTKPLGEGTGLGLWAVDGIVREHNGQIRMQSTEGKGTTIEIFLNPSNLAPETTVETTPTTTPKSNGGIRVLIVDDEPVIMHGLESLLGIYGYQSRGFTNGCEALRFFANDPEAFDIVLTDQVMPDMSGEELIREIKAIRPELPIILCSAYSEAFQRKDSESQRADAYCEKPTQFKEIVELFQQLCNR